MTHLSPYIKKHIQEIETSGYMIIEEGKQLYKDMGLYEIVMTDLTIRSDFTYVKTMLVWVRNTQTKEIEVEKLFRNELLPLTFEKLREYAENIVLELSSIDVHKYSKTQRNKEARLSNNMFCEECWVE